MAKAQLTPKFVREIECPADKKRADIFDSQLPGFLLEVRASGGKTFYVRYRNQRGVVKQIKVGSARVLKVEEARKQAQKILAQISLGADPSEEKATLKAVPTFAEFAADRYMPFVKGYKRSWQSDDCYLRHHLLPAFGKKHLDEITKRDVIAFHHGMRAKGYAVGTCNRCLILLRYAMNLAVRWEIPGLATNPTKDVALFENPNKKERFLSQEEAQKLYEAVCQSANPMLRYIVPMLILTGARKREVLDSKWEDFDLARKRWRIPITKTGRPRHVPLSDGVLRLLATLPHDDDCPWVFANPKTRKPYASFFYSWDTARKQAGLADVRIHDLRHSFASFLVNAGRSLYEVQKILGHTQIRTTQRYAHLSQETLLEAANAVVDAVGVEFASPVQALPQPKLMAA
jgi:integrase